MSKTRPLFRAVLSLAAVTLMAACTTDPLPADYRQTYPLDVHPTTASLALPAGPASWSPDQDTAFKSLVAGYLDRGHGPLTIAAALPAAPGPVDTAGIEVVRQRLLAAGVPAGAIHVALTYQDSRDTVTLSYQRYEVSLPLCGDWTSSPTYDPYNQVHSNFGCANQRNMGLMAADPLDLVRMRDPTATDAQNSGRVVQKFRAGQPTAATPSPLQSSGAAGITTLH